MAHKTWIVLVSFAAFLDSFPCSATDPRIVKVDIELNDVLSIDDRAGKFSIKFEMLSEWSRSAANDSSDAPNYFEPEIFLDTEENLNSIRSFTQTTNDGRVQQLRVLTSTFLCEMDFSWLPIDEQKCTITIRSRVHDKNELILNWIDVIEKPKRSADKNFTIKKVDQSADEECLQRADSTDYSCLRLTFVFLRNYRPYLISYMLPTAVCSAVAWLTLFVRSSSLRSLMTALTILATGGFTYTTYLELPCSHCAKFLDVWTVLVCGLVIVCFLEFIVVQSAFKRIVSGRKRYTINDLKPNCVDGLFQILVGAFMSFSIAFYFTYMYVVINGRVNVF
ncbi:glutamate-gated chloride channel subunit beta-like [Galendromus occidentalis]|uniref:Glutamate-gated chloride channel subunit beta-like n=1 Tax=Galendromus occidentalis TaxID=34638 RepID=A0AAJ6QRM0_9ACAR|nr:glutamate-gated chloride channel subunit beta-like [Galendromus occidentalis]